MCKSEEVRTFEADLHCAAETCELCKVWVPLEQKLSKD